MDTKVLITYASKYGATKEIAEKIGTTIRESGKSVDVIPIQKVNDLASYSTVIIGSAIYIGMWRKSVIKFIKNNEVVLEKLKVWFFSSGPTGEGNAEELTNGWKAPKNMDTYFESTKPEDIALFHGKVDLKKLNFLEKWMAKKVDSPIGDYRNWDAIENWAKSISQSLN